MSSGAWAPEDMSTTAVLLLVAAHGEERHE
jgi:hypothetical protein